MTNSKSIVLGITKPICLLLPAESHRESAEGHTLLGTSLEEGDPCDMVKNLCFLKGAVDTGSSSKMLCALSFLS